MRLGIFVFLVLGVLASGAAVDLSAPSRTLVPAIELQPEALPEVAPPVLPTTRPQPNRNRTVRPRTRSQVSRPARDVPARTRTTQPRVGRTDHTTSGTAAEAGSNSRTRGVAVTPTAEPRASKPRAKAVTRGAVPAPILPPEQAGEGEDDDDDDDDGGDDDGDDG